MAATPLRPEHQLLLEQMQASVEKLVRLRTEDEKKMKEMSDEIVALKKKMGEYQKMFMDVKSRVDTIEFTAQEASFHATAESELDAWQQEAKDEEAIDFPMRQSDIMKKMQDLQARRTGRN